MSKSMERDAALHKRLKRAYEKDMLSFYTDPKKLNNIRCPIFDPWESVGPVLALLLFSVLFLLIGGLMGGTLFLLVSGLAYGIALRPWSQNRQRERAIEMLMQDVGRCQIMWDYGGIGLSLADQPETMMVAPEKDWRRFVNKYFPEVGANVLNSEMAASGFIHREAEDHRYAQGHGMPQLEDHRDHS